MSFVIVITLMTLLALITASYTDLKRREVLDWVSYGLIFSALGIRTIYSFEYGFLFLFSGLLGLLVCFLFSASLYYTHQWGGGDSKLLMGMGAVLGISLPLSFQSLNLIFFFLALLFLGAIYGIIWMLYVAIKTRNVFLKGFLIMLKYYKRIHYTLIIVGSIFLLGTLFFHLLWPLVIFPLLFFYLFIFVNVTEDCCLFVERRPRELTLGDWLGGDVKINGRIFMKAKTLESEDLWKLRKKEGEGKLKKVLVKEGIPFVPSFLLAYIFISITSFPLYILEKLL